VAKKVASELKIGLGLWVLTILVQEIILSVRKMMIIFKSFTNIYCIRYLFHLSICSMIEGESYLQSLIGDRYMRGGRLMIGT